MEHTKAPWVASEIIVNNAPNRIVIRENRWGGLVVADLGEAAQVNEADAALIAAAPELLAALRGLLDAVIGAMGHATLPGQPGGLTAEGRAVVAIAKATSKKASAMLAAGGM